MKLQFLGDSKDSFKWDYHDFLMQELRYDHFKIAWMMTSDDGSTSGKTPANDFPARDEILDFCKRLRDERNPKLLHELPETTGASYRVSLHDGDVGGLGFFSGVGNDSRQVVFIDPDNGFEPERNPTEQHVKYADLREFLETVPLDTVVTVFQHFRRKKFTEDFSEIRTLLNSDYTTALHWKSKLMFVCICQSETILDKVREIHLDYAATKPRDVICLLD